MPAEHIELTLRLPLDPAFSSLLNAFTEKAALALGLDPIGALKLTLASEEVFSHLCGRLSSGRLEVTAQGGGYYVALGLLFPFGGLDMKALNFTACCDLDREDDLENLGLILASRSVDRIFSQGKGTESQGLVLMKEKDYPALDESAGPQAAVLEDFHLTEPDAGKLKLFSRLLAHHCRDELVAPGLLTPAKLADMVILGDYRGLLAEDRKGHVGGGVFWRPSGKTVEFFGPYFPGQPENPALETALFEGLIERVAKGEWLGMISRFPGRRLPGGYTETLAGGIEPSFETGFRPWSIEYRQLREDPGCAVWGHSSVLDFLEKEYRRLYLARDVMEARREGESRPDDSAIATNIDRVNGMVMLMPLCDGRDLKENLATHLAALAAEGITRPFCQLDLGSPWQALWAGELVEAGFVPRLVLPYGDQRDQLILQKGEGR